MRQWEGAFLEGYQSEENGNEGLFDEHGHMEKSTQEGLT